MDLSTMMMMSMMTGPGGPAEGAMPGGMNPMMLMHMMNGGNGMDLSSMVLMQVMMGGGQLDPMTMFALMQQDQGSTSDKIQSYLDKQVILLGLHSSTICYIFLYLFKCTFSSNRRMYTL